MLEYTELYNLQEFKTAITQLQNYYLETENNDKGHVIRDSLMSYLSSVKNNCEEYVTSMHLNDQWNEILIHYDQIYLSLKSLNTGTYENIKSPTDAIHHLLDRMIAETYHEVIDTVRKNQTIQKHGSLTQIITGILFVLLITIISFSTARRITVPIRAFLDTFYRIGSGKSNSRVQVKTKDEFGQLATKFNDLFDQLDKTTVTLEYVQKIIDNIHGVLFVTDEKGQILSCNKIATKLLGYNENELKGKRVSILFNTNFESIDPLLKKTSSQTLNDICLLTKNASEIYNSEGHSIPVMTICTKLESDIEPSYIIVAYDITEKIEFEKQLENSKKKNLVDINEAQEIERTRIAADLHDGLGQKLSVISYSIQNIAEGKWDKEKINYIQRLVDEAINETRTISHSLIPGVLKDFGLVAALIDLMEGYNENSEINLGFYHYDFDERIEPKLEKVLFRICQEALNNIIKHSEAKKATFQLFKSEDLITLTIEDDGKGFDPEKVKMISKGIGLMSIRERVYSFNGSLIINARENYGTELIIEIPYTKSYA
jgi:PAS domain S-box-containing protein